MKRISIFGNDDIEFDDSVETSVRFIAGEHGLQEEGKYTFWTLEGCDEFGEWTIVSRFNEGLVDGAPPEERIIRMEREMLDSEAIEDREMMVMRVSSAVKFRAANYREVSRWMDSHKSDAIYARHYWIYQGKEIIGVVLDMSG